MGIPPIIYTIDDGKDGRRVTSLLRDYWEYIKGDKNFPEVDEISAKALYDIWGNCFIVKADNSCSRDDYEYIYVGEKVAKAFGEDLTGMSIDKMVAPQAGHLAEEYEKVLATKLPIFDEGDISLSDGKTVKYRQILLPLGVNGITIKAIIGGMSYKIFD